MPEMSPPALNADLKALAAGHLLRTRRLEDGELVLRLVGRPKGRYPSDHSHAGLWSADVAYVYIPCSSPNRRATIALAFDPSLVNRSSDSELLLVGSLAAVVAFVTRGPSWARARKKRVMTDEQKSALVARGNLFAKTGGTHATR